jgi:hypothetical protein
MIQIATAISAAAASHDHLTTAGRQHWREEDLGAQISTINVMGGAFGKGAGSGEAYAALMGEPEQLAIVDLKTNKVKQVLDVPGANGSYCLLTSSNGDVYLASHPNGNFYRYKPGSSKIEKIGAPEGVTFIWDLAESADGKIYGACYPKSIVFVYDPATSKLRSLGPAKEGEDYARCIVYSRQAGKLYVGVGSHAALIEIDPVSGAKRDILPSQLHDQHFVYSLGSIGNKLLLRMDPSEQGYAVDLATAKIVANLGEFNSSMGSPPGPDGNTIYFSGSGHLKRFTISGGSTVTTSTIKAKASAIRGFAWSDAADGKTSELLGLLANGHIIRYNPATGVSKTTKPDLPHQPIHIQNIIAGPDKKIYSSGYVVGQVGVYDPATGQHMQFGNMRQAEGMTVLGSRIYFGTYPRAIISVFDTARPVSRSNPRELFRLEEYGQDRPFGMLAVPSLKKVFIGTVPAYGLLGGVFAVYDPQSSKTQVMRNLISNQGIVSLIADHNLVIGGSCINGGLGVEPTEKEAKLFGWDPAKSEKVFELAPVAGKRGISGLRKGPDNHIWGWAEGTLFAFDPESRKVLWSEDKFPVPDDPRHFWRGGYMSEFADGGFYGTLFGNVYHLDAATRKIEVLAKGELELMTRDSSGRLYFVENEKLLRLTPKK